MKFCASSTPKRLALAFAILSVFSQAQLDFHEESDVDPFLETFDDMADADIIAETDPRQEVETSTNQVVPEKRPQNEDKMGDNQKAKLARLWEKWADTPPNVNKVQTAKEVPTTKATTTPVRTMILSQEQFVEAYYTSSSNETRGTYGSGRYGTGKNGYGYGSGYSSSPTSSPASAPTPPPTPTSILGPVVSIIKFPLKMPVDHTMFEVMEPVLQADMAAQLHVHASQVKCRMRNSTATATATLMEEELDDESLTMTPSNHIIDFTVKANSKDEKTAQKTQDTIKARSAKLVDGKQSLAGVNVPKQSAPSMKVEQEKGKPAKQGGIGNTCVPSSWLAVIAGLISVHMIW